MSALNDDYNAVLKAIVQKIKEQDKQIEELQRVVASLMSQNAPKPLDNNNKKSDAMEID